MPSDEGTMESEQDVEEQEGAAEDAASGAEATSAATEGEPDAIAPALTPAPASVAANDPPPWMESLLTKAFETALTRAPQPSAVPPPPPAPAPADPWGEDGFETQLAQALEDTTGRKFQALLRRGLEPFLKEHLSPVTSQLGDVRNDVVVTRWRTQHPHLAPYENEVGALVRQGYPLDGASEIVEARRRVGRYAAPAAPARSAAPSLTTQRQMVEARRNADGPQPARRPAGVVKQQTARPRGKVDLTPQAIMRDIRQAEAKWRAGGGRYEVEDDLDTD